MQLTKQHGHNRTAACVPNGIKLDVASGIEDLWLTVEGNGNVSWTSLGPNCVVCAAQIENAASAGGEATST